MPELPEVETVRAGLADKLLGGVNDCVVSSVDVRRDSCVRHLPGGPAQFSALLTGSRVVAIARRGKFMWCELQALGDRSGTEPAEVLSAHLGMSGQFRVYEAAVADAPAPHSHCRVRLGMRRADGVELTVDFLDQRTFGYLSVEATVATPDGLAAGAGTSRAVLPASVAHIGRDALDPFLDTDAALVAMRRGARAIKQVLLDQTVVSGIGNIYADEALWEARIHPQQPAHTVTRPAAARALEAAQSVMSDALAQGGTSFDALYVNVNGESGYFSRSLMAYGRGGEPCERCGTAMSRKAIGGRSTHWCPRCQRNR